MCRLYGVSRSGYYKWKARGPSARDKEDELLLEKIQTIHRASRETYGSPRVHAELRAAGNRVAQKRVARLMRIDGLRGRSADLYYANPGLSEYYAEIPNRKHNIEVTGPDQVWVGDVTYLKRGTRWLYLSIVMDQYSRKIIGWAFGETRTTALTLRALNQAIRERRPPKGTIFHSDRGAEYVGKAYRNRLASAGLLQSTNRPRRMTDNAHIESFFHSMKSEIIHRSGIDTESGYRRAINAYVPFYNNVRRHSALNYESPSNFELKVAA